MKKGVGLFLLVVAVAIAVAAFPIFISGAPEDFVQCTPHAFILHGQVVNSTFGNASSDSEVNVNVSVYTMSFNNGEPSRSFLNFTNTTAPFGNFSLTVGNATNPCSVIFVLEAAIYDKTSNLPLEVGPNFPPLPKTALTSVLDNLTIYTSNATLLNLTAVNSSWGEASNITFNYLIFDDSLGFPIAENFATSTTNATVVVPSNRNYTVLFMRSPNQNDSTSFANAVPPIPYTINLTQNPTLYHNSPYLIKGNMTFGMFTINGSINVTGNTTSVNVTNILVKLGIAGMMPPNSEVSIPGGTSITPATGGSPASGYRIADYNVTVMGASNGIYQVIEWYASNNTQGEYFSYFQNFTVYSSNINYTVVLRALAGTNSTKAEGATSVHTKYVSINFTDEQGQPLTDANLELRVDNPGHKDTLQTFRYMIFSLTGGVMKLPLLSASNATLRVYNKRYAPSEIRLNVTNASLYPNGTIQVKLSTFKPRQFNPNGTVQEFNSSQGASNFRIVLMKNSAACNVYNASISSCRLGKEDFDVGKFDPLKAMVGGKVNIYSEINTTGVIIYFIGVDMIASGPPEASMSDQPLREAQSASGTGAIRKQVWRFGSVAPPIYDKVFVGIPYNESKFNRTDEYSLFNISFDYLLDNNGNVIWNSTTYPNGTNLPEAYSDYAANWTNASSIGMKCVNETGLNTNTQQCYVNTTTNYIWLNLPHFTDGDPGIEGQSDTTPPATPPNLTAANVSDADNDGNIEINWTEPGDETGESYIVYRFASNISVFNHSLTNITPSRVAEGVKFFEDNETRNNTNYWYAVVAVDSAGNLNTSSGAAVLSASFNATPNDAVTPKSPTRLNVSASGTTATLRWLNVTQDVNGNPDLSGMRYKVYRSVVNATNSTLNLSATGNVSRAISGATITTVSTNTTTFSVGAGGTGTYHFIVTSLDDGGNENISFQQAGSNLNYFNVSLNETAASSGDSSSSSSSSSGGGGGGGAVTPVAGVSQSRSWDSLSAGSTAEFKVTRAGIPVRLISFKVSEEVTEIEVTVTTLSKLPSNVKKEYGGTVYSLLSIAKSNLKDTSVSSVVINFSVDKKWLTTNSANANDIVLARYDLNKWNELPTRLVGNDSINYNYVADSPGLSTFAIALRAPEVVNEAGGEEGAAAAAGANASQKLNESGTVSGEGASKKSKKFLYTAIVLIVLAIAGGVAGFVFYRKSKGYAAESGEEEEPAKPQQ